MIIRFDKETGEFATHVSFEKATPLSYVLQTGFIGCLEVLKAKKSIEKFHKDNEKEDDN